MGGAELQYSRWTTRGLPISVYLVRTHHHSLHTQTILLLTSSLKSRDFFSTKVSGGEGGGGGANLDFLNFRWGGGGG